jgi:DNA-directed RNA polymerase subunit E'
MFYQTTIQDTVRVPPQLFNIDLKDAITKQLKEKYESYISKELGIVIDVIGVNTYSQGIIIKGDGAAFYKAEVEVLTFKTDLQEIFVGKIHDIADFGAFISLGPVEGMIHVSQTMDDFVSFSKDKTLLGKESGHVLKVGDVCKARVIAVSFKESQNPKFGLTMRQPGLGKLEWLQTPATPKKKVAKEE